MVFNGQKWRKTLSWVVWYSKPF